MIRFNVVLRPQRPYGLLGTWSPGRPPRHSLTHLLGSDNVTFSVALLPQRLYGLLGTGSPGQQSRRSHVHLQSSVTNRGSFMCIHKYIIYTCFLFFSSSSSSSSFFFLLYYFTLNVLITSSTVSTADMWVGLGANSFTDEK